MGIAPEDGLDEAKRWYCLYTKPRTERRVYQVLQGQGLECFLPELPRTSRDKRLGIGRPFFPRYLFARLALPEDSSWVRWTPGLVQIVNTDGEPIPIEEGVIQALQEQVQALLGAGQTGPTFRPGERVRITAGPFRGYEGIFDRRLSGENRARILVRFLRRETPYEVETGWITGAES